MLQYYQDNKERMNENSKRWYRENIDFWKEYIKDYQQNNKDRMAIYYEKRQHKNHKITVKEWTACKHYFNNCCAYCDFPQKEHKKYFNQDLHKEHADDKGANDLSNCIPSCRICNSEKNANHVDDWYNHNNKKYVEKNYHKITKWLLEDYKKYVKIRPS